MKHVIVVLILFLGGSALASAPATQPATTTVTTHPATTMPGTIINMARPSSAPVAVPTVSKAHPIAKSSDEVNDAAPAMPRSFAVLMSRSIFLKGQQTIVPATKDRTYHSSEAATTRALNPEENLVFNGVTKSGHRADALIENMTTGAITVVKVGDAIARGKVTAITLDNLAYEMDGKEIHVLIGENLQGTAGPAPSSQPAASATSGPSDENATLERMRLRRLQQLGEAAK